MNIRPLLILSVVAATVLGCRDGQTDSTPAPAVEVKQSSTAEVEKFIASQKGKVVLVNFWATWCPPCRMEIPGFIDLQSKYGAQGLQIVGLSIDDKPLKSVADFVAKSKMNYPIHIVGEDTMKAWGNFEAIPMTFLFDTKGKKVWEHEGFVDTKEFEKQITALLPKK